jgi:hypothetical protein
MDTGATIIVLGIVALVTLPFLFNNLYKKYKNQKFMKEFIRLSEKENIKISQKELWNNCYIIGIDNNSKKIFYTIKRYNNVETSLIDLAKVESCRISKIYGTLKAQSGNKKMEDKLELVFVFRNSDIPEKALEFYKSTEFMPNENDVALIENWSRIINSNLKTV